MYNLFKFLSSSIVFQVCMMLFSIVIIRSLPNELVAEYGFAQGILRIIAPYIGFSFGFHLLTTSAQLVERLYVGYFIITLFFSVVILSCLLFVLLYFGLLSNDFTVLMIVLCSFTASKVFYELNRSRLRALGAFKQLNIFHIRISLILFLSTCLAFWNVELAIFICSMLFTLLCIKLRAPKISFRSFLVIIRKTLPISVSSSLSLVLTSSDLILLKFLGADTQTAADYYLNQFVLFFLLTIPSLVYVFFFDSFKTKTRNLKLEQLSMMLSFFGIIIMCALVFIFHDMIFGILLQKNLAFNGPLFTIFAISVLANGSMRMFLANRFAANGKSKVIYYNSLISASSNIFFSVLLWFPYKEIGVAAGTLLTILLSSFYLYLQGKK